MTRAQLLPRWSFRSAVLSEHCTLPPHAKLILVALDNYRSEKKPEPFPSQEALAADTGLGVSTIRRLLMLAVSEGWVVKSARYKPGGGRTSDCYGLSIPESIALKLSGKAESIPPDVSGMTGGIPPKLGGEVVHKTLSVHNGGSQKLVAPYVALWREHHGEPPYARLHRAVQTVIKASNPEEALRAFTGWVTSPDFKYGVENFAGRWKDYLPRTIQMYTPSGEPTPEARAFLEGLRL